MTLEHNTYKEAISDVKLPDDVGTGLVESAIQRKEHRIQKLRAQAVAAIAGILIIAFSANGICYAQTGMNIWDLFGSFYQNTDSEDLSAMTSDFRECGESITYGNLKFTLEYYYFDAIHGEAYCSIRTDSLDGTPIKLPAEDEFPEWEIGLQVERQDDEPGGMSVGESEPNMNEDHTSMQKYYSHFSNYEKDGSPEDTLKVSLRIDSNQYEENGITYHEYETVDSFTLQPTGELKSLHADGSALDGCTNIRITGSGINLFFDKNIDLESTDPEDAPFHIAKIEMADGTIYYLLNSIPENWKVISDENAGPGLNSLSYQTDTGETISKDMVLGSFACGGGFDGYAQSGYRYDFDSVFDTYIDINKIAALYIDDVEMPLIH